MSRPIQTRMAKPEEPCDGCGEQITTDNWAMTWYTLDGTLHRRTHHVAPERCQESINARWQAARAKREGRVA